MKYFRIRKLVFQILFEKKYCGRHLEEYLGRQGSFPINTYDRAMCIVDVPAA